MILELPLKMPPASAAARRGRPPIEYRYLYFWHRMDRKGQTCAVLARGAMNSCLVQFEDGFTAITSRNAIRRRQT